MKKKQNQWTNVKVSLLVIVVNAPVGCLIYKEKAVNQSLSLIVKID